MTRRPTLPPPAVFWVAAGVLVLALWASGAPAMLFPVFAERWAASPLVTTALFAVYPVALVVVMVTCGSASDRFGRRPLLLAGVTTVAVGTAPFALTDLIPTVFAGRILQGAGVGLAMSAATAAMVEHAGSEGTNRASSVNTAAAAIGATAAILSGGYLAQYSSHPTRMAYWVLLIAVLIVLTALVFLPADPVPAVTARARVRLAIPSTGRPTFVVGAAAVTVAFITGAVFLALGAQIIRDLVGTTDAFLAALTLATCRVVIIPTTIITRRFPPSHAAAVGGVTAAAGLGMTLLAGVTDSLPVFLAAAVLAGIGYGLLVYGGLGMVTASAHPDSRAGTFSTMYLAAYLAQGATAISVGAFATAVTLDTAILVAAPTIAVLCLTVSVAVVLVRSRESRLNA